MTSTTMKSKEEEINKEKGHVPVNEKQNDKSKEQKDKKTVRRKTKKTTKDAKSLEIEQLGKKLEEANDKYLRLSAEYDNYRKRTLKEKMELTKSAGEQILVNILPMLDNFERAVKAIEESKDIGGVKEGIHLIYNNFKEFITQNGIKEIEALHQEFDTDIHEAITKVPAPDKKLKGKVVDCIEKGYYLNDKVIRFAKVVIGE